MATLETVTTPLLQIVDVSENSSRLHSSVQGSQRYCEGGGEGEQSLFVIRGLFRFW